MMENSIGQSIIKTLSYFDIFDYPLTLAEIRKYSEKTIELSDEELLEEVLSISIIQESQSFFYFLGRSEIVAKRLERSDTSIQKFGKARVVAKILSKIPMVEYIGVSGSLSMNNSLISDDIDLFFIAKKNTLWITRFFVNSILILIRQKRSKSKKNSQDKICPNMFIVSNALALPKKRMNLYSAHEIVQLRTLFDRKDSYNKFLIANNWVGNFLPNITLPISKKQKVQKNKMYALIRPLEAIFFFSQKLYMKKSASSETILSNLAMFHPINKEKIILDLYELKSKKYLDLFKEDKWIDSNEAKFYFDEKKIRILN